MKKIGKFLLPILAFAAIFIFPVSSARAKFDANYDTDNADDDNQYHTYDVNINF